MQKTRLREQLTGYKLPTPDAGADVHRPDARRLAGAAERWFPACWPARLVAAATFVAAVRRAVMLFALLLGMAMNFLSADGPCAAGFAGRGAAHRRRLRTVLCRRRYLLNSESKSTMRPNAGDMSGPCFGCPERYMQMSHWVKH